MQKYDALLSLPLKPIPAKRKNHQVTPQMCQCLSPTTFQLTETTHARVQAEENDGPTTMRENRGPLAMLMEEMEQEPPSGPIRTTTDISAGVIDSGDWLAFIYDQNWWLAKAVTLDAHHQDIQVEFFRHGPNTSFHLSKLGEKDMCFVPVEDIMVKLMEPSAPRRASKTREIYHLSAEVMDFIEEEHINRLLPDKAN